MSLENMMEPTGEMAPEQISAIKRSIEIGRQLVNYHPEIAKLYRDGMTYSGIAESLDVKGKYGASDKVARTSIHRAITGHAGGFKIEPYDGLISDLDELAGLEHEHRANGGRKTAELGLGVHAINPETGYAHLLSLEPEFQHQKGPHKGKGDYKTIAQVLNEDYHNGEDVRNANAVKINLFNYKKSLGN